MSVIEQRRQAFLRGARHLRRVPRIVVRTVREVVAGEVGLVAGAAAVGSYGEK